MTIAVMQPYLFPYLGYFQLLMASDTFVFFDDVNFIKRGYIHRNRILQSGNIVHFSVPLHKPSQNQLISQTKIKTELYEGWKKKFLKQLQHAYSKAPFYAEVLDLVRKVLNAKPDSISDLAINSVKEVCEYLGLDKDFSKSSELNYLRSASAEDKVLRICKTLGANNYINPMGGAQLYEGQNFKKEDIQLKFQNPVLDKYRQPSQNFFPALSILDLLFNLHPDEVIEHCQKTDLKTAASIL